MSDEEYTAGQLQEMRDQVLGAALALALRAADAGEATEGARYIQLDDTVKVGPVAWRIKAQWDREDGDVVINGNVATGQPMPPAQFGPFLLLFSDGPEGRGKFGYDVPVAWLRAVALAHDPRT